MLTLSQLLLIGVNLLDFVWVSRMNVYIGIPDAVFMLGDDLLAPVIGRLNQMPFLIFAAKLCPPKVEAAMFALFMGLSNFGTITGYYIGSGMLSVFGGVEAPEFNHLGFFVVLRSLTRALPLLLIPFLVPTGTPSDDAKTMGAGAAVFEETDDASEEGEDAIELTSGMGEEERQEERHARRLQGPARAVGMDVNDEGADDGEFEERFGGGRGEVMNVMHTNSDRI
jgi:hypothetical protein